jgi:AraC family transcriptional regulator
MDPVGKALWFIESHFAGEMTLEAIAAVSGVSHYHLSRAFGAATPTTPATWITFAASRSPTFPTSRRT